MAQKGAAELIFRGRREQKAAFPPWTSRHSEATCLFAPRAPGRGHALPRGGADNKDQRNTGTYNMTT